MNMPVHRSHRVSSLVAAAVFLIFPFIVAKAQIIPEWLRNAPEPDENCTFFIGSASDKGGDVSKATREASADLVAGILRFMGFKGGIAARAAGVAALDSYSGNLISMISSTSFSPAVGFAIKDRFVSRDETTGMVSVNLLASYVTKELRATKDRLITALQTSGPEIAVMTLEREGSAFLLAGRPYDAVGKFIEAAVVASGPDVDDAAMKVARNIGNARTSLSSLGFDTLGEGINRTVVSQPFPQPFRLRVVAGEGDSAPGVSGASLQMRYRRLRGTRSILSSETVVADPFGFICFIPPPPDVVGESKLFVSLDFRSSIELLDGLPESFAAERDTLLKELLDKTVELPYEALSPSQSR